MSFFLDLQNFLTFLSQCMLITLSLIILFISMNKPKIRCFFLILNYNDLLRLLASPMLLWLHFLLLKMCLGLYSSLYKQCDIVQIDTADNRLEFFSAIITVEMCFFDIRHIRSSLHYLRWPLPSNLPLLKP